MHLDAEPEGGGNTGGTLLYHLAAIEADWLYVEVLQENFPDDIVTLFPVNVRDETGRLTPVPGVAPTTHLERFAELSEAGYRRLRRLPDYEVTHEWVLHRGQILQLRGRAGVS